MEKIYLGYNTAQWYWENAKNAAQTFREQPRTRVLESCASSASECRRLLRRTMFAERPLHVVVDHRNTSSAQDCIFHCHSKLLPKGAFVRLSQQLLIARPELCFVQIARSASFWETVLFGDALCGSFALDPSAESGVSSREPLLSSEKLRVFLDENPRLPGIKKARAAARYVVDGSASPRESKVAMALALPRKRGGKALPIPRLNARIDLSPGTVLPDGRRWLVADFLWPEQKVAAEYDSTSMHANRQGIYRDSTKRNALIQMGYTPICITEEQLNNPVAFNAVVDALRAVLGIRNRSDCRDNEAQEMQLRKALKLRFDGLRGSLEGLRTISPKTLL